MYSMRRFTVNHVPDWHDIESLALHDPVLHAAVTRVRQGASREQALIAAVMVLSEQVTMLRAAKTDALMFGSGFVHVAHASGEFQYRRLDPASVTIRIDPPREVRP
jgi:hypothetical protein